MPKQLMNDIREGSIDIAEQTIDLEDLDAAYAKDYDKAEVKDKGQQAPGMDMGSPMGGAPLPPLPGGPGPGGPLPAM